MGDGSSAFSEIMGTPLTYLYDGSFEGLLTAVAVAVKSTDDIAGIYSEDFYMSSLVSRVQTVATDHSQAMRLFAYLHSLKSLGSRLAIDGFLSENDELATHLYRVVSECVQHGAGVLHWHTHDSVRLLHMLSRKVRREAHRLNGLVRFRVLEDGLQYAPFEPDYNVIGYLGQHFRKRLAALAWVLHDVRRNQAIYWDGGSCQDIHIDEEFTSKVRISGELPEQHLCQTERHYQRLWSTFHEAIAIKERRNQVLQRKCMPSRYWKYLPEIS